MLGLSGFLGEIGFGVPVISIGCFTNDGYVTLADMTGFLGVYGTTYDARGV